MRYDILVLRALVRISARGASVDLDNLLARVGGEPADVRASLRRLDAAGLVVRTSQESARLTFEGLTAGIAATRMAHGTTPRVRVRVRSDDAVPTKRVVRRERAA
ncbi:MAG: hypothetical protein U0169_15565 [Polyangiaceae bacterium]